MSRHCPPLVLCGWGLFCVQALIVLLLSFVAGLCVQALVAGLSSSCPLWLGFVSRPCPPLVFCGWGSVSRPCPCLVLLLAAPLDSVAGLCVLLSSVAGLCVQALSSSCSLWPRALSSSCPCLGRAPDSVAGLCGPALCPGLVLLLSLSWPRPPVYWRGVWPNK